MLGDPGLAKRIFIGAFVVSAVTFGVAVVVDELAFASGGSGDSAFRVTTLDENGRVLNVAGVSGGANSPNGSANDPFSGPSSLGDMTNSEALLGVGSSATSGSSGGSNDASGFRGARVRLSGGGVGSPTREVVIEDVSPAR